MKRFLFQICLSFVFILITLTYAKLTHKENIENHFIMTSIFILLFIVFGLVYDKEFERK